ncbi:hypothetical protein MD484_g592, partial [Candolleomyces efflorescens]
MPRATLPRAHREPSLRQRMIKARSFPLATLDTLLPSYLLLVTLFTDFNFPRSREVFALSEIMLEILQYCDWYTLMSVSRSSVFGRSLARIVIRGRLRSLITPFMPPDLFLPFMTMLHNLGGGIIGSVPRLMLAQNAVFHLCMTKRGDKSFHAFDLNIVVPYGKLERCRSWFEARGFTHWADFDISTAFLSTVVAFTVSVRYSKTGQSIRVSISESRGGIFQVLLASPITSQTNLITPSRIYSLYPNLVHRFDTLVTDRKGIDITVREDWLPCYELKANNLHWKKACGPYCPALRRRTHSDPGIASFHWSTRFQEPRISDTGEDAVVTHNLLFWRFANRCRNMKCKNYQPSQL